jgi:hypothetical protein
MVLLVVACAHPPKPSATEPRGPLRFAVLGDRTDEPDDQLWQRVVGSVAARGAPLVVTVGDLVDEPDNPVEWTRALTPLAALARVEHTPGNHDILDERTATTFVAQTGQATYRSFDVQGVHFVVLDSSIADRWDQLPDAQRTWFDADLAAHVVAHRGSDRFGLQQRRNLVRGDGESDAACDSRGAADQAAGFELDHHAVHRRRRDAEEPLHVRLGGRLAVEQHVRANKREVLTLLLGELRHAVLAARHRGDRA